MFHLLSPLAVTGTCYVSFAVSTCSHRQNTAGFQASAGQWPSARAVVSTWDGELEAACLLHLFNPFTAPACKISGLKHAQMRLQNSIFSTPVTSIFSAVHCDESPFTLFRCPFHPRVTAMARGGSWSFCQRCGWRVTAEHAYTLRMWLCMK